MLKPKRTFQSVVEELEQGLRSGDVTLDESTRPQGPVPEREWLQTSTQHYVTHLLLDIHSQPKGQPMILLHAARGVGNTYMFQHFLEKLRQAEPKIEVTEKEEPPEELDASYGCVVFVDASFVPAFAHGLELWLEERPRKEVHLKRRGTMQVLRVTSGEEARRLPELLGV